MEAFSLILIILLLILVLNLKNKITTINTSLEDLKSQFKKLGASSTLASPERKPIDSHDIIARMAKPEVKEVPKEETSISKEPETIKSQLVTQILAAKKGAVKEPVNLPPKKIQKPVRPSFMERNPDLEKFIGENLLSKIGIVIFVIGMGFLVKLGIDSNVISEGMRVAIGILIGGGMIGLAHYLRNSFVKFSSILIGGALAVLYFSIALAFHEYNLIPQTAAFIIMVLITGFSVLLSISYDRKELAVLAIIGGFGTPFFVSSGNGDFVTLLSYILILDIGMLALVYFKKWNVINYLVYAFTYILFSGLFISNNLDHQTATTGELFVFLTAFYLIFFLMSIIYNVANKKKFQFTEVGMLLSNSAIYFGFGLSLVHDYSNGLYSGLFTGLIAIFNFGFTYVLFKRKDIDKNLLYLLIGLVLTFLTLIAPVQLKGNFITLFWALESVLLLWLSIKSGIKIMKLASVLITLLMFISLVIDWQQIYLNFSIPMMLSPFLNKAFLTSFISMGALFAISQLMVEKQILTFKGNQVVWKPIYIKTLLIIAIYGGFFFELNYQFYRFEFQPTFSLILLGIFSYAYIILLGILPYFKSNEQIRKAIGVLSILAIISYMTGYTYQISFARDNYLASAGSDSTGFFAHYILLALFAILLIGIYREIYSKHGFKSKIGTISLWILAFITVFISSTEFGHLSILYSYVPQGNVNYDSAVKSVYPIVWAITALALMISGMKFKLKTLRLASLGLFLITIIKLFFYDLAGNSTGKIISFILLGVILLVISFLYQKLKFILQDDKKED
ncbi:MAG: DUF2339 domain-containing protein [Reichenbachiella sp.]